MDDLGPFFFLIFIALVQFVKFLIEKNAKAKKNPQTGGTPPAKQPSAFEEFFGELARKLEPQAQPAPQPDWPEAYERPDYMQEMEDVETDQGEEPPLSDLRSAPEPAVVLPAVVLDEKTGPVFQSHTQISSSVFEGISAMRLQSIPLMRSTTGGEIDFDLKDRKQLKQAIIANLVFSPPRAYDCSFDTTLAK